LTCTGIPTDQALGKAGRNPWTHLDLVALQGTGIRVRGWAFDPDASNGVVAVHFRDAGPHGTFGYDDGLADRPRSDVNRAFNILGRYGFQTVLPWTGPGRHTICATAINIGRGTANPRIGCRSLAVRAPSPLRSPGGPRTTGDQPAVSERTDRPSAPAVSSSPDSRPPKAPTATAPSP